MIKKCHKKIEYVEALQFDGNNFEEMAEFIGNPDLMFGWSPYYEYTHNPDFFGLRGDCGIGYIYPGDYIIKGQGGLSICRNDDFERLYEV